MLYYYKIFKVTKKETKGKKANYYEFVLGKEDIYIVSFSNTDNSFIYDINLKYGKKFLTIRREIVQTKIDYYEKLEYFLEALKKNNEKKINYLKIVFLNFQKKKVFLL